MRYLDSFQIKKFAEEIAEIFGAYEASTLMWLDYCNDDYWRQVDIAAAGKRYIRVAAKVLDTVIAMPEFSNKAMEQASAVLHTRPDLRETACYAGSEVESYLRHAESFNRLLETEALSDTQTVLLGALLVRVAEDIADLAWVWSEIDDAVSQN